jgi:hypothetical protein
MSDASRALEGLSFSRCRSCGKALGDAGLFLGDLPVCNRFTKTQAKPDRYALALDQCVHCCLVQLRQLPPVGAVVPRVSWIAYREPDAHLEATVEALGRHLPQARSAFGLGPFEGPLLDRLAARGLNSAVVDVRPAPLERAENRPYLETWQLGLTHARLSDLAKKHGKADIVSCRYLIEHCHDPIAAIRGLSELLSPGGLIVVEVPDSSQFLSAGDYCFLWEEHVSYFVEQTLRRLAVHAGFKVVDLMRYEGQLEDAMVMLIRPADEKMVAPAPSELEVSVFERYRKNFVETRADVISTITNRSEGAGVALFGIGHQAIMFANLMGIADSIAAAVDDDANKRNQFPPGFKVPVTTSAELVEDQRIRTCLLAINPSIEHKIRAKLAPLAERGVQFYSIFAGVPESIMSDRTHGANPKIS